MPISNGVIAISRQDQPTSLAPDVSLVPDAECYSHLAVRSIGIGQFRAVCDNLNCGEPHHYYAAILFVTADGVEHRFVLEDDEVKSASVGLGFALGVTSAYEYGLADDVFDIGGSAR